MSGRKGSSGHQNLIRMSSMKLLNEIIGDKWLNITLIRETPLDIKTQADVMGEKFGTRRIAAAEVRMYADIACAVVYDPKAVGYLVREREEPAFVHLIKHAKECLEAGNHAKYYEVIRTAYGFIFYIVECELNPRSNLLRDGPRLTAYKLIKQQNNNLRLILSVFEGTKVDNPGIFDDIWEFPRKTK